ncbi:MAG: uracil-DNA glycosylase, partial [Nanoarchaeota archaeon]
NFSPRLETSMKEVQGEGYHAIFPSGNPDSKIMIVGEAPGRASQGIKDQDKEKSFGMGSGVLLDEMLTSIGLNRDKVWVTNIIKCNTPKDINENTWTKEELKENELFLLQEFKILEPRIIITLGKLASDYFLKSTFTEWKFGEKYTKINYTLTNVIYKKYYVFPLKHPAYIQRNMNLLEDYKQLWLKIKMTIAELNLT